VRDVGTAARWRIEPIGLVEPAALVPEQAVELVEAVGVVALRMERVVVEPLGLAKRPERLQRVSFGESRLR
jgi:hypothetical protein